MVKALIVAAALLAAGCTTTPKGTFCAIAEPHRFSDAEIAALSDESVARELGHNRRGERLCGWRP